MLYERWPIPNREGLLTPLIFPFGATRDGDMQMRFTDEMETNKKSTSLLHASKKQASDS